MRSYTSSMSGTLLALSLLTTAARAELKTAPSKAVSNAGSTAGFAETTLAPKSGSKTNGHVLFTTAPGGLKVTVRVKDATPGNHGIHIHEKGDCSAEDASSAGGHFNPTTAQHAAPAQAMRHAGDLGNITVKADGTGILEATFSNVQGMSDWTGIVGKSVVVHEKADDLKSQPAGDSGKRIACGVISATSEKKASL